MMAGRRARWARPMKSVETRVGLVLTAIIFTFSQNFGLFSPGHPSVEHLGAEYFNIAAAIADGRGYSDPFGVLSGSTAWMPPLLPFLMAGLLLLLKTKAAVAQAVVLMTIAALVAAGVTVFGMAKRFAVRLSPMLAVVLYVVWLWTYYSWFFMMTHDIWLLTLLACLIAKGLLRVSAGERLSGWRWGLLGGATALASPAMAVAWATITIVLAARSRGIARPLVASLVLATAMAAPWLARNAVVFHRFVPTKSNVFYEAYQANYLDDDGIYDGTFVNHPYNSVMVRYDYSQAGEMAFVDKHRRWFFESLARDPARYLRAVANRLLAVTVRYVPSKNAIETPIKSAIQGLLYPVPFLMFLACVSARGPTRAFVGAMGIFCGVYLSTYVLVAFYLRYMMPLTPTLVLVVFLGADRIATTLATTTSLPLPQRSDGSPARPSTGT